MFDPINVTVHYNNILTGYVKDQDLTKKQLIRLIDTHPTFDDLSNNFISLISSDEKAIFQAKRIEPNEWEIDVPYKKLNRSFESISFLLDHENLVQAMTDFYFKSKLFELIYQGKLDKIKEYLKSEYFAY